MYNVVILGCENSHADEFCKMIKDGKFPSLNVVGAYSETESAEVRLNRNFGVYKMKSVDEFVGKVDGVIVVARHGDNHYKYAKPYIKDGIPMFIDKPITCKEEDAVCFMQELKANGIRVCGGSTCPHMPEVIGLKEEISSGAMGNILGGNFSFPIYPNSPHGGFHFYAQHLTETMTSLFGQHVEKILASENKSGISFVAKYPNFDVTANYLEPKEGFTHNGYYITLFGSNKTVQTSLEFGSDSFRGELEAFVQLLDGEKMTASYEEFIYPVFVNNAIIRSMESGSWEKLNEIRL